MIKLVLFDFGGVIAEEGFRNGLKAIAERHEKDPQGFFETGRDLVYSTGYVTGDASEEEFWDALRKETGVNAGNEELRQEILDRFIDRFILRREMLRIVRKLRESGPAVGLLSDQTNWLEELDRTWHFCRYFDPVFNSYRIHKGKKDRSLFRDIITEAGLRPEDVLFIDDSAENIKNASAEGLKTIHFKSVDQLKEELVRSGLTATYS